MGENSYGIVPVLITEDQSPIYLFQVSFSRGRPQFKFDPFRGKIEDSDPSPIACAVRELFEESCELFDFRSRLDLIESCVCWNSKRDLAYLPIVLNTSDCEQILRDFDQNHQELERSDKLMEEFIVGIALVGASYLQNPTPRRIFLSNQIETQVRTDSFSFRSSLCLDCVSGDIIKWDISDSLCSTQNSFDKPYALSPYIGNAVNDQVAFDLLINEYIEKVLQRKLKLLRTSIGSEFSKYLN